MATKWAFGFGYTEPQLLNFLKKIL